MTSQGNDGPQNIYVGYLPTPRRILIFLRVVVPVTLWGMVLISLLVVQARKSAGDGFWDVSQERTWTGTLFSHPYPMLYADGEDPGPHLLVGIGKFGVQDLASGHDGSRVTISGYPLRRDGRRMIELGPQEAVQPTSGEATPALNWVPVGQWQGLGELVDGKCFLGAMKPGDGRSHRACALLCIRGGLPMMLAVPISGGKHQMLLVTGPEASQLDPGLLEWVGMPVSVSGMVYEAAGLQRIELLPNDVTYAR
jgi:hypothetical protein